MSALPIDDVIPAIQKALLAHASLVIHAPPGAGKTTRVPLALREVMPPEKGRIVVLEPRRLAAVSAARWMARTLGEDVGKTVGYSIRFDSRVSASTRIEVVTEGILTRRIQTDPSLEGIAMLIFDEFHERSLNADLALALCLDIRRALRDDLKILVMSATLECGPIASLLGGAPVISSGGRAFPVEERYLTDISGSPLPEQVAHAVTAALATGSGDILVFLPGSGEIRSCAEALRTVLHRQKDGITLHPLYGDLPFEEQERAILPSAKRKIVLATNIAETSLTIEGVRIVIDSGLTRRLRYNPSLGMNRLVTGPLSKASAEQRKGRAGRLGPGICFRLYRKQDFQAMLPFAPPEILVSDLSELVLQLAVWGVKDPSTLSWLNPPPSGAWEPARELLIALGALDPSGSATSAGRTMAQLPLHPRLARMLLKASQLGCLSLGADLAALLSERDVLRQTSKDSGGVPDPDVAERLDILAASRKGKEPPPSADPWALRTIDRTSAQLLRLMRGVPEGSAADPVMISRLLLCAFPDRVAKRRVEGKGRFVLSQGRGILLSPASPLSSSPFIIAVSVDAGERTEGRAHIASPVTEELLREECSGLIETVRRVEWNRREDRILSTIEERLGTIVLATKPFTPSDEETAPLVCGVIRSAPDRSLTFGSAARQFQCRVALLRRLFPGEAWPDLSESRLTAAPEEWLLPWLGGVRTLQDLSALDVLPALHARLSRQQMRLLTEQAPVSLVVPSGHRIPLDYAAGDVPVLAVKLQEMFGLADTPAIAGGRIKVLLHLLSPARKPVQVTQDLKGFWNRGYQEVKKELKGRYPKHPWPDDPWNAVPTRRTKPKGR